MASRWLQRYLRVICAIACLAICRLAVAAEHHGQVTFGGLPVPGATVTAILGNCIIPREDRARSFSSSEAWFWRYRKWEWNPDEGQP